MPTQSYTVRANNHSNALTIAMRQAEAAGLYPLRATRNDRVGPWTEDDRGTQLFDVTLQVDREPESVMRAMEGDR